MKGGRDLVKTYKFSTGYWLLFVNLFLSFFNSLLYCTMPHKKKKQSSIQQDSSNTRQDSLTSRASRLKLQQFYNISFNK